MKESKKMGTKNNVLILVCAAIFLLQFVHAQRAGPPSPPPRAAEHFVLVHGSCQGAWAWNNLVALLRSSGHNVTALDLAASGINLKHVLDIRNLSDYVQPIRDFMASLPQQERVILVGHSFGGLAISQLMETFPEKIAVAVFLTAFMPGPSLNLSTICREMTRFSGSDQLDNVYTYDEQESLNTFLFGPKYLASNLYQLSPVQDFALATLLVRPFREFCTQSFYKDLILTNDKYGSVSRVFIVSEEDKALRKEFQEYMIRNNPPNEVEEIRGSDHMVMISKPIDLFVLLKRISEEYLSHRKPFYRVE